MPGAIPKLLTANLVHSHSQAFPTYLAKTWAESYLTLTSLAETCQHRSSPVCVASNVGHSAGEIYKLAEAADEVDGNKGILRKKKKKKNQTTKQGSALTWEACPSPMVARKWLKRSAGSVIPEG